MTHPATAGRPPASWFGGYAAEPVTLGLSGAVVWALRDRSGRVARYVKAERADATTQQVPGFGTVLGEAARTTWLHDQGMPAAEVVRAGADDDWHIMVTTALPGVPISAIGARQGGTAGVVDRAVAALAGVLSALHDLPPATCPFARDLEVLLAGAAVAVDLGTVDAEDLDDERAGASPADLLAVAVADRPVGEDLVVAHGDACLPNVLIDPETGEVTGLVDLGRLGIADRHADLALAVRSLARRRAQPGLRTDQRAGVPAPLPFDGRSGVARVLHAARRVL